MMTETKSVFISGLFYKSNRLPLLVRHRKCVSCSLVGCTQTYWLVLLAYRIPIWKLPRLDVRTEYGRYSGL